MKILNNINEVKITREDARYDRYIDTLRSYILGTGDIPYVDDINNSDEVDDLTYNDYLTGCCFADINPMSYNRYTELTKVIQGVINYDNTIIYR